VVKAEMMKAEMQDIPTDSPSLDGQKDRAMRGHSSSTYAADRDVPASEEISLSISSSAWLISSSVVNLPGAMRKALRARATSPNIALSTVGLS
jgi:hypothetical protein